MEVPDTSTPVHDLVLRLEADDERPFGAYATLNRTGRSWVPYDKAAPTAEIGALAGTLAVRGVAYATPDLAAAGRHHELVATVADPAWLAVRISRNGTLAAERDLNEALRWEPGEARLSALLRRLQQTAHLLDRAATFDGVPVTLAIQLWPIRRSVDLERLGVASFEDPLSVSWIADPTSPNSYGPSPDMTLG